MRKKSHLALSAFLAAKLHTEELNRYGKAFCLGSILPDLNPKMLSEPHEFDGSWNKIRELILKIESDAVNGDSDSRALWVRVGIVLHYLADYFTFPHNSCYDGNLKDHCLYESRMKYLLRAYLSTSEAGTVFQNQMRRVETLCTAEALFSYIEQAHQTYMMQPKHAVLNDCCWIVDVCSCVMAALVRIVCGEESAESAGLHGCAA